MFTSPHAIEHFFRVIAKPPSSVKRPNSIDIAELCHWEERFSATKQSLIFAVIGKQTQKALQKYNIQAAVVAQEATAQGLLKAMAKHLDLQGKHVLFPRSSLPNPFLKEALIARGALVTEMTIYENIKPAKRNLPSVNIEGVIFTSPSTVRNFLADYGTIPPCWRIMAKGPVTLKTLQDAGYHHAASLS
jgi:uroporphyrinogen-III synthase